MTSCNAAHAQAGRAPLTNIPANAAIQQEATQGNIRAMPDGKCEAQWCQCGDQCPAFHRRLDAGTPMGGVDFDLIQRREIEQQAPIANR